MGTRWRPLDHTSSISSVESSKAQLVEITTEKEKLNAQLKEAEQEVKKQKQQIQEMQERGALNGEVSESFAI